MPARTSPFRPIVGISIESASAPRSCRWQHRPPDAACAISGPTWRHSYNGPGGTEAGGITGSVSARRRLTVLWSGAEIVRPIKVSTDVIRPSVWRKAPA